MASPDITHWLQIPFKDLEDMKFVEACKMGGVIGEEFGVRAARQGDRLPIAQGGK